MTYVSAKCEGCGRESTAMHYSLDDVRLCDDCFLEAAQEMTQEPYQPCAKKDMATRKRSPHQELLEQWANDQGFQTWSQDHADVLRNLAAWLDKHTATLPESIGLEPCDICGSTGFHKPDCALAFYRYNCPTCGELINNTNSYLHTCNGNKAPLYVGVKSNVMVTINGGKCEGNNYTNC